MSLHLPIRRVAQTARSAASAPGKPSLLPHTQRRNAWFSWGNKKKDTPVASAKDPMVKEMSRREREMKLAEKLIKREGDSMFDEEIKSAESASESPGASRRTSMQTAAGGRSNIKAHNQRETDPDPRWRVRWQKKKVMQMVRAGPNALSRQDRIALSEKKHTSTSTPLGTSTKKLVHLSHQIVGKSLDEAITQMRFSKKKAAREVLYQLQVARDEANVIRGMGLGCADGAKTGLAKPRQIITKDGQRLSIDDPTKLYVDESWVGKGPYRGARVHYRARSAMSIMWRPTARLSVVLKEEKTRIRQHDEAEAKAKAKKPWVHLPNRPVTSQRPYYSW